MKYNTECRKCLKSVSWVKLKIVGFQTLIRALKWALTSVMLKNNNPIVGNGEQYTCKLVRRERPLSTAVLRIT